MLRSQASFSSKICCKMSNDDINDYLPSVLNPRRVRKQLGELTLTQNSIVSRCSLSLRRKNGPNVNLLHKTFPPGKQNAQSKISSIKSMLDLMLDKNTKSEVNSHDGMEDSLNISLAQEETPVFPPSRNKENVQDILNISQPNNSRKQKSIDEPSIGFSAVEDINTDGKENDSSPLSLSELLPVKDTTSIEIKSNDRSLITLSSATELSNNIADNSSSTIAYEIVRKPTVSVSFGVINCKIVNVSTKKNNIKNITVSHQDNGMNVDCEICESSKMSVQSDHDEIIELSSEDDDRDAPTPPKKSAIAVNLEIKKKTSTENSKVLILNTNAIQRLSHVIVQPPNYKLVKRQISDRGKFKNNDSVSYGKLALDLKQKRIDSYFVKKVVAVKRARGAESDRVENANVVKGGNVDMSKNLGGAETAKRERQKASRRESVPSPPPRRVRNVESPGSQHIKGSNSEQQRHVHSKRNDSASTCSPRKNQDSLQFTLPKSTPSNKPPNSPKNIPYHKIITGTHFAVDAFSYGDIPTVKTYFLTHFHSDHYSGLKKGFDKTLFCSKITADLCITRLGVSPKCINIINCDEPIIIDGVEVLAVDANHCPGALMLLFTLSNGKTMLHTGDFRASPHMESYPVFWNKDIHTIYLDSTYCNPRYDFPTQDQCLEMALYLLRQKKLMMDKASKKFSSVLIVCGTYTIGKEKFFMGMAQRVGCSVWACPEKDKVLQAVEGRSFNSQPATACQLHVVPMRDLTHEKLHSYLESLHGAFSEVVAFKPSGWENGKNSTVEKDLVTIHGIPYSEHSSFSEMIRFVKFLQPKQVVPTVDISGGIKAVQKFFPCPLVGKEGMQSQSKMTDFFSIQNRQHVPAVT